MRRFLAVTAAVALLGCSGDKTTGPGVDAGSMSFSFTGGGGGTFFAVGVPVAVPQVPGTSDWAAGYVDVATTTSGMAGVQHRPNSRYDVAVIGMDRVTVGSASVDPTCDVSEELACTGMFFAINAQGELDAFDFICVLESGSIAITEVTASRVKGTFSGTGICIDPALNESTFTVSTGTFDVPLVTPPQD